VVEAGSVVVVAGAAEAVEDEVEEGAEDSAKEIPDTVRETLGMVVLVVAVAVEEQGGSVLESGVFRAPRFIPASDSYRRLL